MKFRKTAVIDAIQWTGKNTFEIATFIEGKEPDLSSDTARDKWETYLELTRTDGMRIFTLEDGKYGEAAHVASVGDWIIKGVQGECYPCKPDIFAATYEAADKPEDEVEPYEVLGTTSDGIRILAPKEKSTKFTPEQIRAAIKSLRLAAPEVRHD